MTKLIYRVVSGEDWELTLSIGGVPRCGNDERDGYVHLSPFDTVLETAGLYFTPDEEPLVLEVDAGALGEALRWESVASRGGALFPHLYADGIPVTAIMAWIELVSEGEGQYRFGLRTELEQAPA
jgi:uncharacterized protein (DUF952 family)